MTLTAARKAIARAKGCADEVLGLVRQLGDARETEPLSRRYSAIMSQPIDFSGEESLLELRGELMMAVGRLVEVLRKDFLTVTNSRKSR
ncbi:MAG: hypothetical protein RLY20_2750 [Verrucomicrobiota bacterium]|jgi:hypothetical protein